MKRLLVILFTVLLVAVPVSAQDTSAADAANTAFAIELLKGLFTIITLLVVYQSVPASVVRDLLKLAEEGAKKTVTPIDDVAVKVGQAAIDALRPETPAITTTVTTETKVTESPVDGVTG